MSGTATDRYLRSARDAGCPPDLVRTLMAAGIILQPRQLAASAAARSCDRQCTHDDDLPCGPDCAPTEIGYGGARGGGKSHWGISQLVDDCMRFPGLKCLLLRKVGKANRENFEDLRRRMLSQLPHKYKSQDGVLVFNNGSRVHLGHFKDEKDIDNYLGIEYDVILVEEATTLSFAKYRDIRTCCRSSKPGWRPRMYSTTNPGGMGHQWYKEMFIDPAVRGDGMGPGDIRTDFVQATVYDNSFVDRGYKNNLKALTGWQRRAWLYGDWDIAAGQFFTNYDRRIHVHPMPDWRCARRLWRSLDYGFVHYTAVYLMAEIDGDVWALDEHAERRWLPERHVSAMDAMLERHGIEPRRIEATVAGRDVFHTRPDGGTVAETYKDLGVKLTAANDNRINGWGEILKRFGDQEADPPIPATLFISDRCRGLINCLPALQHDEHNPEDVDKVDTDEDGKGGDDWADAFRYGVQYAARPRPNRTASMGGRMGAPTASRPN